MLTPVMASPREQLPTSDSPFHEWPVTAAGFQPLFYRLNENYLIRIPALADFVLLDHAEHIVIYPVPDASTVTIEDIYTSLIEPVALGHQRKLVFHASAVQIDQHAVAFVGGSGLGKSTLAASFAANGARFLSDDGTRFTLEDNHCFVEPGDTSIRLWPDSAEQVDGLASEGTHRENAVGKFQLSNLGKGTLYCPDRLPIKHVYFLGPGESETITITPVKTLEAVVELLSHRFLLDVGHKEVLKSNVADTSKLANELLFFHLDYPRDYAALADVRAHITEHSAHTGDKNEASPVSICQSCSMCCDGTLFETVLADGSGPHPDWPIAIKNLISTDRLMPQPCQALRKGSCSIYSTRPQNCQEYTCMLYDQVEAGEVSRDQALLTIESTLAIKKQFNDAIDAVVPMAPQAAGVTLDDRFAMFREQFKSEFETKAFRRKYASVLLPHARLLHELKTRFWDWEA